MGYENTELLKLIFAFSNFSFLQQGTHRHKAIHKKKKFVCCTYPILTPLPPNFFDTSGKENFLSPHFHQKITIFPLCSDERKRNNEKKEVFLPTYPTQKYRVGVQQTNNFLRIAS